MRLSKARREIVTAVMKDTIAEAADSVLQQHGVGGMTMDRVATTAGLATASLYNYFRDKEELVQFIYARVVEPFFQAIEETAKAKLPAPRKLEIILRTALEHAVRHKGLIRLLAGAQQGDQIRRESRPRSLRIFVAIFEQGIREGSFRPHNSSQTGRLFLASLGELFELQMDGASDVEVNEFVDVLIDTVLKGFSLHPEKTPNSGEAGPSPSGP
jgi:AcrR family transcriptional regulator